MTSFKESRWFFSFLLAAVCAAPANAALGLRSKFAEVEVKGLKIGKTYSLKDLVNFPLRVTNTGTEPVDLKVTVWPPFGGENKPGFEPIPDTNWIHVSQSTFTVFQGMDGVTDVVISIPNDEKLLGRRFIAYLWTESENKVAMGVGLKSRILIFVSSQKPTEEELKQKFVAKRLGNLNFSFAPMEASVGPIPVGKRVSLKDLKADLKLVNPNDTPFHFRFTPIALWETEMNVPGGYEAAPDPKWLIIPKPVVNAGPDSFTPLDLRVEIPDDPQNRGKSYMFVLRAEILEQDIPAYAYAKVLVTTEKEKGK